MTAAPLLVLSGPSGVGKTTVVQHWLAKTALPVRRAITATTRAPRTGEKDAVDYHFWTLDYFQNALNCGEMLEHAVVHGQDYYGTPRAEVDPIRAGGTGVILVIDVQGAAQVRAKYPQDCTTIFLTCRWEQLEARLRSRGTEDPARVQRRLASAQAELARSGEFDTILVNDDLETTVRGLETLARDAFQRRGLTPCSTN
jgi:guanylate kinase